MAPTSNLARNAYHVSCNHLDRAPLMEREGRRDRCIWTVLVLVAKSVLAKISLNTPTMSVEGQVVHSHVNACKNN